jgi:MFS family permease
VSLVFSLAGFLYCGLGSVSGPLADRFGSRRLVVVGMLLTGAGLAAAGAARSLLQVYAAYGPGVGLPRRHDDSLGQVRASPGGLPAAAQRLNAR